MTDREIALRVAWHYLGRLYRWGGDDPSGFDCSGFVIEALESCGRFPRGHDDTAEGLRQRYRAVVEPRPADLVFWLRNGRACHVGMVIDPSHLYIGADGGRSTTITDEDAVAANAFIKIRPIRSRGTDDDRWFASPFDD